MARTLRGKLSTCFIWSLRSCEAGTLRDFVSTVDTDYNKWNRTIFKRIDFVKLYILFKRSVLYISGVIYLSRNSIGVMPNTSLCERFVSMPRKIIIYSIIVG